MTWTKAEFKAGLIADDTPLAAEGGFVDGDLIRFRQGKPELIGGWTPLTATTFTGVARGGKAWANLTGAPILAFGTQSKLYAYVNSTLRDVTPKYCETLLPLNPFICVSTTCTVTHPGHGLKVGDSVTFAQAQMSATNPSRSTAAGNLGSTNGAQTVASVIDSSTYTVTLATGGNTVAYGGAIATATTNMMSGNLDAAASPFALPRTWNIDNFGEAILAAPDGRKLFAGVISDSAPTDFLTDTGWAKTGNWSSTSLPSDILPGLNNSGNLSKTISANVTANRVYKLAFGITVNGTVNSFKFKIDVNTASGLVIIVPEQTYADGSNNTYTRNFSFDFTMPADPTDIVFECTQASDGGSGTGSATINGSIAMTEVEVAEVVEAPIYNETMIVDPNRFVVMGGTVSAAGTYDPMLVRWSDQENFRMWVPADTNLAGEIPLTRGGRIVGMIAARQQNLIFTDESVHSMQFTGSSGDVFSIKMLGAGCGLIGRFAAAEYNGTVVWMSNNHNFYIFQGAVPQIIDCPVRAYVFDALNTAQQSKVYCGVNSAHNEFWWFYPRDAATDCSHYVAYNFVENHWTYGTMDRSTWLPPGVFSTPIGFDVSANTIYKHESTTKADGAFLPWSLTTSYFDIKDGDQIGAIRKFVQDFERQTGQFSMTVYAKYWPNSTAITFGPYTLTTSTTETNFRISGRQLQVKWHQGGSDTSEFVRWGATRFDVVETAAHR